MNAAPPPPKPTPPATAAAPPVLFERSKTIVRVRQLIYLYLILLIFEGALRKWVVPQLSNPLLLVRDPVVLAIYILALRAHCFRWNGFTISAAIIGILCWVEGVIVLLPYLDPKIVALVTAYGFRSDFLHLPLIFVIPSVFNFEDVKRIGWYAIVGLVPMSLLMAWQFHASPDAFINRVAGTGEGTQIFTSGGKIRPPGTFSFTSGANFYLAAGAAFLLHAVISRLNYKAWIIIGAGLALILGVGVSGSRATVLAVGLVVAMLGLILAIRPDLLTNVGGYVLVGAILIWAVSHVPIFKQGVGILSDRFTESAEVEENTIVGGLTSRTLSGFTECFTHLSDFPVTGWGLGVGTNGGARFLNYGGFLLSEDEWTRILAESGPILGMTFLLWRVALGVQISLVSYHALKKGNTLPLFIWAADIFAVLNAPLGQPTNAGFAVVLAGFCLAAANRPEENTERGPASIRGARPVRGRSPFAERLHDTSAQQPNGSADR